MFEDVDLSEKEDSVIPEPSITALKNSPQLEISKNQKEVVSFTIDHFVFVNFEGILSPGIIIKTTLEGYRMSVMENSKKNWKWLIQPDGIMYDKADILLTIP